MPENQLYPRPHFLLSLALTPINIVLGLFSRVYSLVSYLLPIIPRILHRITPRTTTSPFTLANNDQTLPDPSVSTDRFLRDFSQRYGEYPLPFLNTTYARAYDLAKSESKFLLVIPISPHHTDTPAFIRQTLLSGPVVSTLTDSNKNVLLWAGSTSDSEAYRVATSLLVTRFPAAVLICPIRDTSSSSSSAMSMSIVARISGPTAPEGFSSTIEAGIAQHAEALSRARSTKSEQQAVRNLREEQQSAYERSLAQDRERTRTKREEQEKTARGEREERARVEREAQYERNLKHWKRWRASYVEEEPESGNDTVRVSIRLLGGDKVIRRFRPSLQLKEVYAFVECYDEVKVLQSSDNEAEELEKAPRKPDDFTHEYGFRLVSPMPRCVYDLESGGTIRERIGRSANLIAERIEEGEEEES